MRIARSIGFIAAAALAACGGSNVTGISNQPVTPANTRATTKFANAMVAPGRFGRLAIRPGTIRPASHRVHRDFVATKPCTYLSGNLSGDVRLYNKDLSLAGDFGTTSYGWGAAAGNSAIYLGTNNGSGNVDLYTPCTNHFARTLTGLATGGNPYGITIARNTKSVYATDWPIGDIEYWPNGSTTAQSVVDPNIYLPYFLDADNPGNVYVVGYNAYNEETMDECTPNFSSCTTKAQIYGGFPGGVQVDQNETVYLNDQFGTLYSFDCSASTCTQTGSFTYNNGSTAVDYTDIVLDKYKKHTLWGANIFFCSASFGICADAQPQSLPLNTAVLGAPTPAWDNEEPLGIVRYKPDTP